MKAWWKVKRLEGIKTVDSPSGQGIDPPVVKLCDALNKLPGISTDGSCSGHGKGPFLITFDVDYRASRSWQDSVAKIVWAVRHHGNSDCHKSLWQVVLFGGCDGLSFYYNLESIVPSNAEIYKEADEIAETLVESR
jgi:hypothetical protein